MCTKVYVKRKVQIRIILGTFLHKIRGWHEFTLCAQHVLPNVWCSVQYTDSQVGSDGDLGEGEEEEGGGAGLGMGDVLGGVVTLEVTVGGAKCECV